MLLEIKNLNLHFQEEHRKTHALKNINLHIDREEILGIAGESGCGKTLTSLALMNLLPNNASYQADRIMFMGQDLQKMSNKKRQLLSGTQISMIFQDPMASLNPSLTIETQITELLRRKSEYSKKSKKQLQMRVVELLDMVGITSPEKRLKSYSFELSGGMCQRVMIAMALSCNPKLLIADEPTTGLDVTIQSQILALLKKLQQEFGIAIILISHDLSILSHFCDRINIMYAGTIIEKSNAKEIIKNPQHPYTKGLLSCLPSNQKKGERLSTIAGIVPDLSEEILGCSFYNRCPYKSDICKTFESKQLASNHDIKKEYSYYNCHLSPSELKENKWI